MPKIVRIKALDGFSNASDGYVVLRATTVCSQMPNNPHFTNPPIDLQALKAAVERLQALMAEALDGSKKVIAEKNRQREVVIKMLQLLGRYVEITCKDDMAIFKTSGYEPASTTRTKRPALSDKIRKIGPGSHSGELLVWIKPNPEAYSYELRYGVPEGGAPPTAWTSQPVTEVRTASALAGLTPGATYWLQARVLVKGGFTDWSDPITFICT